MLKMNRIKRLIIVSVISLLIFMISGCNSADKLIKVGKKNIQIESELPQFELDKLNYNTISYDESVYLITKEEIKYENIGEAIGKISFSCVLDKNKKEISNDELKKIDIYGSNNEERFYLTFGWIYKINNISSDYQVAININNLYYKCVINN